MLSQTHRNLIMDLRIHGQANETLAPSFRKVLGPWAGLLAAGFHTVSYLLLNAAINAIGHLWGGQPYPNRARNNQWLAWITCGEGLHNNHHAAPTSANLALARGEIDPAWLFVRLLVWRRWATVRLDGARVKERLAS